MKDRLYELNKEFAEDQIERDTCGMGSCHAPKVTELQTEAGLPIAVCTYHELLVGFPEEMREDKAQKWYDKSFEEIEEDWNNFNQKIKGENNR